MHDSIPRQIILCCDGTNNFLTGGESDTNVVRLCNLINNCGDLRQILFYDPGVGNPSVGNPEELSGVTGWERLTRSVDRISGLAFGKGVFENITGCYQFLMQQYQSGDEIYIFGFSRGAFTARSVASLVNMFGILQPHLVSMVPTLLHVHFSDKEANGNKAKRIAEQANKLFSSQHRRHVHIHFLGVWDSVASVDFLHLSRNFRLRASVEGQRYLHVRHALALDEHRAMFTPRQYVNSNGHYRSETGLPATLKQLWFSGAHCDVGGGYAPDHLALADHAMAWLTSEATHCGLRMGQDFSYPWSEQMVLERLYAGSPGEPAPVLPSKAIVHSELHSSPLWALTGMSARMPGWVEDGSGGQHFVGAEEHPSVQASGARYPRDTVWARSPGWLGVIQWYLVSLAMYGGIGQMLLIGESYTGESFWGDLTQLMRSYPDFFQMNVAFARWQMLWWFDGLIAVQTGQVWEGLIHGLYQINQFGSPRWALLWDLGMIVAYAQVLSRFCVAGFARGAGLRRVGQPVSRWLARLGWALPLLVFSDLGENLATWLTITLAHGEYYFFAVIAGAMMALLALLKWIGLVGVFWLIFWPTNTDGRATGR